MKRNRCVMLIAAVAAIAVLPNANGETTIPATDKKSRFFRLRVTER